VQSNDFLHRQYRKENRKHLRITLAKRNAGNWFISELSLVKITSFYNFNQLLNAIPD